MKKLSKKTQALLAKLNVVSQAVRVNQIYCRYRNQ